MAQKHSVKWMCVGVPKAGTTSLYHVLKNHPEVWIPKSKETHFFSSHNYDRGRKWYLEHHFKDADFSKSVGEMTPAYLRHPGVPYRIKDTLGDRLKFIVLLRNPVERAWSDYCHAKEKFHTVPFRPTEFCGFEEAIKDDWKRKRDPDPYGWTSQYWLAYLNTGMYAEQLMNWLKFYDRTQFLIITLDEMLEDPTGVNLKITDHIQVSRFPEKIRFNKTNSYSTNRMPPSTREYLYLHYRLHNEKLSELLGRDFTYWNYEV